MTQAKKRRRSKTQTKDRVEIRSGRTYPQAKKNSHQFGFHLPPSHFPLTPLSFSRRHFLKGFPLTFLFAFSTISLSLQMPHHYCIPWFPFSISTCLHSILPFHHLLFFFFLCRYLSFWSLLPSSSLFLLLVILLLPYVHSSVCYSFLSLSFPSASCFYFF